MIVTQLHATTVTKLFAKTTIWFLLCKPCCSSYWDADMITISNV